MLDNKKFLIRLRYLIKKTFLKKIYQKKVFLNQDYKRIIKEVEKFGISKSENFLKKNEIDELILSFEKIIQKKNKNDRNQIEIVFSDLEKNSFLYNFFWNNKNFDHLSEAYLLTKATNRAAGGKRIFPMKAKNFANYQWHHDGSYMSFKVFILLSDLDKNGQKMTYLKKSHKLWNGKQNKILDDDDKLIDKFEKFDLIGKKGTCYFFDGNGFHRGNRNESYVRDILNINYEF